MSSRIRRTQHPWFKELQALELEMLDPDVRGNASRLQELLGEDFVEFGSSGRVYDRKMLVEMLVHEEHARVAIRDLLVREISADVALITYRTVGSTGQEARRSSVWARRSDRWQMVFHQGTRIPNSWALTPGATHY